MASLTSVTLTLAVLASALAPWSVASAAQPPAMTYSASEAAENDPASSMLPAGVEQKQKATTPGSKPAVGADSPAAKFSAQANQKAREARVVAQQRADDARQLVADAAAKSAQATNGTQKLEAGKLSVCKSRQDIIATILNRLAERGDNTVEYIDTVSQRVQDYYARNQLAVEGYDALLASVNSAKTSAQSASTMVDDAAARFDCGMDGPKAAGQNIGQLTTARSEAIKAYRDTVVQFVDVVQATSTAAQAQGARN